MLIQQCYEVYHCFYKTIMNIIQVDKFQFSQTQLQADNWTILFVDPLGGDRRNYCNIRSGQNKKTPTKCTPPETAGSLLYSE